MNLINKYNINNNDNKNYDLFNNEDGLFIDKYNPRTKEDICFHKELLRS